MRITRTDIHEVNHKDIDEGNLEDKQMHKLVEIQKDVHKDEYEEFI